MTHAPGLPFWVASHLSGSEGAPQGGPGPAGSSRGPPAPTAPHPGTGRRAPQVPSVSVLGAVPSGPWGSAGPGDHSEILLSVPAEGTPFVPLTGPCAETRRRGGDVSHTCAGAAARPAQDPRGGGLWGGPRCPVSLPDAALSEPRSSGNGRAEGPRNGPAPSPRERRPPGLPRPREAGPGPAPRPHGRGRPPGPRSGRRALGPRGARPARRGRGRAL